MALKKAPKRWQNAALFLGRPGVSLTILAVLLMYLLVHFYPGAYVSGDFGGKYLQVLDFEASGFQSFACRYPGAAIDPEFRFVPFRKPFFYHLPQGCFHHFPFQLTAFLAPFHALFGIPGLYLPSFLSALALLFLPLLLARRIGLSRLQGTALLWIYFMAFGLPLYAINPNEYALSAALVSFGIYFSTKRTPLFLALSGMLIGLSVMFRAELAGLGLIVPVSAFLFWKNPLRSQAQARPFTKGFFVSFFQERKAALLPTLSFLLIFFLIFIIFILSNKTVTGHLLGLRGIEFLDDGKIQHGLSFSAKLKGMALYLFARKSSFFLETPLLVFSVFSFLGFFGIKDALGEQRHRQVQAMLFSAYGYLSSILLIIPPNMGPQFGERFFLPVYPILALGAGLLLFARRYKRFLQTTVLFLSLFTLQRSQAWYKKSKKNEHGWAQNYFYYLPFSQKADAVILRQKYLMNLVAPDYPRQWIFLADSDADFLELTRRLKKVGKTTLLVLHSRPPFRGQAYNMPETLVPPDFSYKTKSKDLGRRYFEMRLFGMAR